MQNNPVLLLENLENDLEILKTKGVQALNSCENTEQLHFTKAQYLGKKGKLKEILSSLSSMSPELKAKIGKLANDVQNILNDAFLNQEIKLKDIQKNVKLKAGVDVTAPGRSHSFGALHPLTETRNAIFATLEKLGFIKVSGPEIEYDFYNFEALNFPHSHPSRDMQDSFYIDNDVMLRTHTSSVQIRAMLSHKSAPLKIMSFGRVYRRDDDITHSPMFHQIEGLCVDEKVSLSDLKTTLEFFAKDIFSADAKIRMRPSFFPFTEPSIEIDVSCFLCEQKSSFCRLCKSTGWIEILGAGMVDPEVFKSCNYDFEKYQGFAFGMGIERIAMLRYGITDIRSFFENDVRFLKQF